LSPANTHDIKEALATVEAIPAIQGPKGRPRKRPESLRGDKAYDSAKFRSELREKRIEPKIEKRRQNNHNLGKDRWLIERSFSWLNRFRRLRIRYERRSDIHEAFLYLGCALICGNVSLYWFC
jgi:transposase